MFNRENWVGVILVGLCGVVAIALLIEIFTDVTFTYSGPQWLARIIAFGGTAFVLVMSYGALKRRFSRHGGPGAPRGGPSWPQNDLPRRTFRSQPHTPTTTNDLPAGETTSPPESEKN
jgi:hypothetical protein